MPDTVTALRVALDGKVTEYELGDTRRDQAKVIARALLDTPQVVVELDSPGRTSIVVFAGLHRAQRLPNLYAAVIQTEMAFDCELVHGPVVFAGITADGHLTSLPAEVDALIRHTLRPDHLAGIPVLVHLPL
ncbi:hypothetical protein OG897_35445 [Streptomyces sp. NBC_00237]|uniref:hypothetical protein n=1 Tax=Streptomyces sp. NBC_00237 TaxID=2975687 RepID=UPI0022567FE9|nr:hypothetical protein [Streptomyces sp. NBC_00237]MCX5206686.1 hypothetical protein [Streptomyces sp. NBC_00237]